MYLQLSFLPERLKWSTMFRTSPTTIFWGLLLSLLATLADGTRAISQEAIAPLRSELYALPSESTSPVGADGRPRPVSHAELLEVAKEFGGTMGCPVLEGEPGTADANLGQAR